MAKQPSRFVILGRFNSTRSLDVIYTVKRHVDIPNDDPKWKHVSCNCIGWKFSIKKKGVHDCRHTQYVREHPDEGAKLSLDAVNSNAIAKLAYRARSHRAEKPKNYKAKLALACEHAGVELTDVAFKKLAKSLRPYLDGMSAGASASETELISPAIAQMDQLDNGHRIITLDS
jgi:hypothetical protein